MEKKEGDELGLEPIRQRLMKEEEIMKAAFSLHGIPKILLRNHVAAADAAKYFDKYELRSEYGGISQSSYPDKAVDFLIKNNVKGNFFNDFNSGAYLLGRAYPNIKVFIDGRTEVYGGAFFKQYQEIWDQGNSELFEKVVEQYRLTGALLNATRHHIPKEILNYLYQQDDWHIVYFNYDAVIFLKDVEANRALIDRFKIDLTQWKTPATDLYRLGALHIRPYRPYYRGYTLESLDLDGPALNELNDALRVDPMYADAHDLAGKIYAKRKEFQKAFEHFRISLSAGPKSKDRRYNLALAYLDLKEYQEAIKQYQGIVKIWPNDPKGHFFLAKAYIANGQFSQAVELLKKGHQLSPDDIKDLLELGDLLLENKAYTQAKAAYTMGLATNKELATVHRKLGEVALAMNDRQQAKMEFQEALSFDPEDEEANRALINLK
jgi:Tfp pilus assembly protein PilF